MTMAGKYGAEHAGALADVMAAGAPIRFTAPTRTAEDAAGVRTVAAATVVDGYATDAEGGRALLPGGMGQLVATEGPVLLVVCTEYGAQVPDGATCMWGGVPYTVQERRPYAPDGVPLFTIVTLTR
jgi:hypothetical protein